MHEGVWVGVLAGRDSAVVAGLDYGGSVRSDGWARLPMVRMTNVGLEPGPHTLEEIIAATDDGIFMDTNRSWSIDDRRLNFQFGCEIGYEIKNGKIGRMLRNPTYTGIGPTFWQSMDMLSSEITAWGIAELRQGSTRPDRAHRSSGGTGPVHRRTGGGDGLMSAELDLAGRVVDLVRRLAGSDAQAEVLVDHTALALTRFANSGIHQNVADATTAVRLRMHLDGRTVGGSTTVVDEDGLTALVERTIAAVALTPVDPGWPGLAPAAPLRTDGAWDEATAQATPDERAARVRAFVDAAEGLETAGYCRTVHWSGAFANSAGQSVQGRAAEAAMDGIARVPGVRRRRAARLAPARRPRRRGARRPGRAQGPGRRRPGRASAGPLRGGARADRGRRPADQLRAVRVQREDAQRTAVVRRDRAPRSSTRP